MYSHLRVAVLALGHIFIHPHFTILGLLCWKVKEVRRGPRAREQREEQDHSLSSELQAKIWPISFEFSKLSSVKNNDLFIWLERPPSGVLHFCCICIENTTKDSSYFLIVSPIFKAQKLTIECISYFHSMPRHQLDVFVGYQWQASAHE